MLQDWFAFFNISLCCCPSNQAAEVKSSDKHTFGAVNCHINTNFCAKLGVNILPLFKIYSWGRALGAFRETSQFDAKTMRQYIDTIKEMELPHPLLPSTAHEKKNKFSLAKIFGFKK